MLDLQSFVSEIGGRARPGRSQLWLIVTGQEKLEEESKDSVLFKLQDRFPPELRVHLDRANVREVVGRRLLKKKAGSALETFLTDAHIDALKLHAFECASVTRAEVVENYPLLPAHIPLFMDITQSIRNTSIRTQSDSGGVRSVLNNIWDLFNREPVALKNRDLGTLLTIDMLYDIIGSSIDSDVQLTLHKIFEKHPSESWECKTVKAIALLELNSEQRPVQPALLASLLYPAWAHLRFWKKSKAFWRFCAKRTGFNSMIRTAGPSRITPPRIGTDRSRSSAYRGARSSKHLSISKEKSWRRWRNPSTWMPASPWPATGDWTSA